jgi:hypothetical protein
MTNHNETKPAGKRWKQVLAHEMAEYLINFALLSFFFVAFAWYRRLLLASYHIEYFGYWAPLIQAAILAKVIMIGEIMHMGRHFRNWPLVVPTIYRTVVFGILVVAFKFVESIVGALIHGKTVSDGITEITSKGLDTTLAACVLTIAAFVPFFTVKEIERVFGPEKVHALFFRRRVEGVNPPVEGKAEPARPAH